MLQTALRRRITNVAALVSSTPVYTNTAFISSTGNDGTAVLNDPTKPFLTWDAAATAMYSIADDGNPTTIIMQSNIDGDVTNSGGAWYELLANGLTLKSNSAVRRTATGAVLFGQQGFQHSLTTQKVDFTGTVGSQHQAPDTDNAGTITGDATIATINLSASVSAANQGATGANGSDGTGTPDGAPQPAPNSPPDTGVAGGAFTSTADNGSDGDNGNPAFASITLLGTLTVTNIIGTGQPAGKGGTGGVGGTATGGAGGQGGDSNAIILEDGGTGGAGGDATSTGGNGGTGGIGGNGLTVHRNSGVTITAHTLTGGAAGTAGAAGAHGTATGGAGGAGGAGAVGGNTGPTGAAGNATANDGGAGSSGSAGADGTITVI